MSDKYTFSMTPDATVEQQNRAIEGMKEDEKLRSALITWRNAFESGNVEALHLAYGQGNAALGVPPEMAEREAVAVRAIWNRRTPTAPDIAALSHATPQGKTPPTD